MIKTIKLRRLHEWSFSFLYNLFQLPRILLLSYRWVRAKKKTKKTTHFELLVFHFHESFSEMGCPLKQNHLVLGCKQGIFHSFINECVQAKDIDVYIDWSIVQVIDEKRYRKIGRQENNVGCLKRKKKMITFSANCANKSKVIWLGREMETFRWRSASRRNSRSPDNNWNVLSSTETPEYICHSRLDSRIQTRMKHKNRKDYSD